jgi:hypothetical protein
MWSSIVGIVVNNVGFNSLASPLVLYLILLEVYVKINGDPYPIVAPVAILVLWIHHLTQTSSSHWQLVYIHQQQHI